MKARKKGKLIGWVWENVKEKRKKGTWEIESWENCNEMNKNECYMMMKKRKLTKEIVRIDVKVFLCMMCHNHLNFLLFPWKIFFSEIDGFSCVDKYMTYQGEILVLCFLVSFSINISIFGKLFDRFNESWRSWSKMVENFRYFLFLFEARGSWPWVECEFGIWNTLCTRRQNKCGRA